MTIASTWVHLMEEPKETTALWAAANTDSFQMVGGINLFSMTNIKSALVSEKKKIFKLHSFIVPVEPVHIFEQFCAIPPPSG